MSRPARRNLLVLAAYVAISLGYFGWRLLPHPGRVLVGGGQDPLIFVWSFAWWPHAVESWTNPFVTHALYAPQGINLTWTTSVPGLALAFSPVTLLFGPAVSYNAAALLLPALAAWTAYLLCRRLTGSTWAAVVGGYLFGFSSFVLGQQLQGHLHMTGIFLIPLLALAVVRYVEGEISRRGLALRLGALLALQLSISIEIALTMTVALAVCLLLALGFMGELRPRLRSAVAPIAAGYALAAVLASPLVVYLALGFHHGSFTGSERALTDLANVVVPTRTNGLAGSSFRSVGEHFNDTESALYLGLPTLLVVALYGWRTRSAAGTRFLLAGAAIAFLIALGSALHVDGHRVVSLPWALTRHLPALDNARGPRFALFLALAAGVIVALWTATTRGRIYARPFVLPALAVAALVPSVTLAGYRSHPERWAFFTDRLYEGCIPRDETVVVFPFGFDGDSMLWQAESGFRFRLAEGYMHPLVRGAAPVFAFDRDPTVEALKFLSDRSRPTMDRLLAFAAAHDVGRVLSVELHGYPSRSQMTRFGAVQELGGMLVAPGCGRPSLATRDLSQYVRAADEEEGRLVGYCLGSDYYTLPAGLYPAGILAGATPAIFVAGAGLGCTVPAGYTRRGFATPDMGVPADTYPLFAP